MTWYCLRTHPQREFLLSGRPDENGEWCEGLLEKKGYAQVFCPTETKFKKAIKKGRRISIPKLYPMFTGYIFVGGSFSWLHLLSEPHVLGVVGFPDEFGERRPAPISEAQMAKLKSMSGALVPHKRSVNPHRALRVGELAEIAVGPFQGQICQIEGIRGQRARVFLKLFEREVQIAVGNLEAA